MVWESIKLFVLTIPVALFGWLTYFAGGCTLDAFTAVVPEEPTEIAVTIPEGALVYGPERKFDITKLNGGAEPITLEELLARRDEKGGTLVMAITTPLNLHGHCMYVLFVDNDEVYVAEESLSVEFPVGIVTSKAVYSDGKITFYPGRISRFFAFVGLLISVGMVCFFIGCWIEALRDLRYEYRRKQKQPTVWV